MARYAVTKWATEWVDSAVWGTFAVNVTDSLVLGLIVGLAEQRFELSPTTRAGLTVGVMGGYTTFSTLMLDSARQLSTGSVLVAAANIGGSVALGLTAVLLGLMLGRAV